MSQIDLSLAKKKLLSAISSLESGMESDVVLRPSSCGHCPRRLWFEQRARADGAVPPRREARYDWYALQGTVIEHLLREMLEYAGAEIMHPPERSPQTPALQFRDPVTGMEPHTDGSIRWPEIDLHDWAFLEFKGLRVMASIEIILNGLKSDRSYWFQSVAYLMLGRLAIDNMRWDIPTPTKLLLILAPKDPATMNMMMGTKIRPTQKELKTPEKMKREDWEKAAQKAAWRSRLEEIGDTTFYLEIISTDDPDVQTTWEEILKLPALLEAATPPPPLHNPGLPEPERDVECAAYCDYVEDCLMAGLVQIVPGEEKE